jgi:hypothetical protein
VSLIFVITRLVRALELEEHKGIAEEQLRLREKVTPLMQIST